MISCYYGWEEIAMNKDKKNHKRKCGQKYRNNLMAYKENYSYSKKYSKIEQS
jgi:hypothetical protein